MELGVQLGKVYTADDGTKVKVYMKDGLNEGCTYCHFFINKKCRINKNPCYVTYIAQVETATVEWLSPPVLVEKVGVA